MACRDDYSVGWICTLAVEMEAAKAMLDHRHPDLPANPNDTSAYVLGSLSGHNVVVACLPVGVDRTTSAAIQMLANFKSIRFSLMVGIGGGVPSTKEDIRLGDIVVSRPTAGRPGIIQYDSGKQITADHLNTEALKNPSALLLTAAGKVETINILGESKIPSYIASIVRKDPVFASPGPKQDRLFQPDYDHVKNAVACDHCDTERIQARQPRGTQNPKVHYGLVASGKQVMRHGPTRDKLACEHGILCFETEAASLIDITQCLVIRGICDYADSHKNKRWQCYAAAVAAAYAKEILTSIPAFRTTGSLANVTDSSTTALLDALLLTKPEVDRSSLITLKGRRVDGTCEWLLQHPAYQKWLEGTDPPLLWISGGPGKGKTMLAIYLTEVLQPVVSSTREVLLYYFCSSQRRNSAISIMRGVLYQLLSFYPHLTQYIQNYFEGPETTKYTISSFVCLWKLFLIILHQVGPCKVVCILDGLDECEEEGLRDFLDAIGDYFFEFEERPRAHLKIVILSRPQPAVLESKLYQFLRIKLDDSDIEVGKDIERYISTKVAELASEDILSDDRLLQVREALTAGAEGTFLWVGFVADELKEQSWLHINNILRSVPKGLGGIYRQLLLRLRVEDKEILVPILQWVVLAVRPMTVEELAEAAGIQASDTQTPAQILKDRLASCRLLVKIDRGVVNLVHESAREFFQSEQVNIEGTNIFYMTRFNHRTLMRTCLAIIEESYKSSGSISDAPHHNTLLTYACLHWPQHFRYAFDTVKAQSEFSRQFFLTKSPVREDWWRFYWDREQYGGSPPSFTLLHLAAYFGHSAWAKTLLDHDSIDTFNFRHPTSQRDSYGRTPLFWAAARGHREVVELLLDHGANINTRDRGKLTALHIAVTATQNDIVSLLIDQAARIEEKANFGETPLIRAIRIGSKETVRLLLERGARVDQLPTPPGMAPLKGPAASPEDRARELLGLRNHLVAVQYESESKLVDLAIRILSFSLRFQPVFKLVARYLRHWAIGGWETLQDLVKNDEEAKLRTWAQTFIKFGNQLVDMRDPKKLDAVETLSVNVFEVVSTPALGALLVIAVMVGSSVILRSTRQRWREGTDISARTFAKFASLAYQRDASEALDTGVRQFLFDLDACIRNGRTEETVDRVAVAFNALLAVLSSRDPRPTEYMLTVITEYFEGFIGGVWAERLLDESSQACANEFIAFDEREDSLRLNLFLSAILQLAQRASEKGQAWFLNLIPASCEVLCRADSGCGLHQWLIGEGIPESMSALISRQQDPIRKQAFKVLLECLIIGRQSGISLSMMTRAAVKRNLESIDGVDRMLNEILGS